MGDGTDFDIVVSGGGVAGLAAICVLGADGWRVLCLDPSTPVTDGGTPGADLRTTALLRPARDLLAEAGVWPALAPHAAPLQVMRIVQAGAGSHYTGADGARADGMGTGDPAAVKAPVTRDFDAADLGDDPFGWNVPNWLLMRELVARIATLDTVEFRPGVGTAAMLARDREALLRTSDGGRLRCRLAIAADGRDSPLREAAGIPVRRTRYGQKALAFAVTHPVPHRNVSTEVHRSGGPFTLVPLPDREGRPASAVIWMEDGPEALRLADLPVSAFEAEASARSEHVLGPLALVTGRAVWPIVTQVAGRMSDKRLALMAEAAHVVPPIGAQGLNMSLADLSTLRDLLRASPADPGAPALLDAYHRRRHPDIVARAAGIDALNRMARSGDASLRSARAAGLTALHDTPPLRRLAMRLGLGGR